MATPPGDRIAEEQAALRRVATLVARGAAPEELFAAVTEEAGRVLDVEFVFMHRYGPGRVATAIGVWTSVGVYPVGTQWSLGGRNVATLVLQTHEPARIDDHITASGQPAEAIREFGIRSAVGVPVTVEGQLWGVMGVGSAREPLPAGTEARLAGFTELVATAIANTQARMELRRFADEQAALRRVATLVARAAPPEEVFTAVTEEAGRLLGASLATLSRYDPDGAIRVIATWNSAGAALPIVGTRWSLGGRNMHTLVFQAQRPARIDDYASATGPIAEVVREFGHRAAVGVPISIEGRLWGLMVVGSRVEPLPAGTEERLAGFTELAATAIANAEGQAALTASRARLVATADATRRRFERDLHDRAQQRLVSIALQLRAAQAAAPAEAADLAVRLAGAVAEVAGVLDELREIANGLHPAVLTEGGLRPALKALARRSAVPVRLDIRVRGRLPEPAEIAAYYVVAEALTNAAKHAHCSVVDVEVAVGEGVLRVCVRDDGRGGADFASGSGLVGLRDRVEALGGRLSLHSPPGAGTTLEVHLPAERARS